jgi:hypothetical protein
MAIAGFVVWLIKTLKQRCGQQRVREVTSPNVHNVPTLQVETPPLQAAMDAPFVRVIVVHWWQRATEAMNAPPLEQSRSLHAALAVLVLCLIAVQRLRAGSDTRRKSVARQDAGLNPCKLCRVSPTWQHFSLLGDFET